MREPERKLKVAIYMRLSKEDAPGQGESGSIRSQREMLRRYVEERFPDCDLAEYIER